MDSYTNNTYSYTGEAPKLKSIYAVSLYDPKTGTIRHLHRVLSLEGSSPLDPQQIEKNAIANAEKLGHDVTKLKVLHSPDLQDISGHYRVDVKKTLLVKIDASPTQLKNRQNTL